MWQLGGKGVQAWVLLLCSILALEPKECSFRENGWGLNEVSGAGLALSPYSVPHGAARAL